MGIDKLTQYLTDNGFIFIRDSYINKDKGIKVIVDDSDDIWIYERNIDGSYTRIDKRRFQNKSFNLVLYNAFTAMIDNAKGASDAKVNEYRNNRRKFSKYEWIGYMSETPYGIEITKPLERIQFITFASIIDTKNGQKAIDCSKDPDPDDIHLMFNATIRVNNRGTSVRFITDMDVTYYCFITSSSFLDNSKEYKLSLLDKSIIKDVVDKFLL
jgi:hypothetical protein